MAHAARIENGVVREVIVVNNSDLPDDGKFTPEVEQALNTYLNGIGLDGDWKLTSYNSNFRGTYAGQGFTYDPDLDEFVAPAQPDPELVEES